MERKKRFTSEKGLLSLEASIALTIFLFLMFFLYSFFVVFEARNEIAHVMLASSKSLSLDKHETEKLGNADNLAQLIYGLYGLASSSSGGRFVSKEAWFGNTDPGNAGAKGVLTKVVKERFVAYLANGDEAEANKILKRFHIVNGLNGLDFSDTHITDGKLFLSVKYTLEYEYQVFGKGNLKMEQSCCTKLWE